MNFIELLYVVLIYYISGGQKLDKEAEKIIDEAHSKSTLLLSMCPYMGDAIDAMRSGKPVDLNAMSVMLYELIPHYKAMQNSKATFAEVLGVFAKWFKNQNGSSHAALGKLASRCDEPYIRQMITESAPDQASVRAQTKALLGKLGFKKSTVLTTEEEAEVKANEPEAYKTYRGLRAMHALAWKTAIANYVKDSGKKIVPCPDVMNFLASQGIEHAIPTGFTGGMDAECNWYTKDGLMLGNVPKAPVFTTVTMRSKADGDVDWVCKANKPNGEFAYVYTKEHNQTSWTHKYEVANVLIKNIDKYRKKWLSNLKTPFPYDNVNSIASVVIELLYLSSDRAGTAAGGNEGGSGFGMCSILCKHVTLNDNGGFLISYKGKDAVQFKFRLSPGNVKDKIICGVVAKMLEGKSPRDPVWSMTLKNGSIKPVGYSAVSSYFKSITGGCNIHKLRTVAGTGLFNEEAQKIFDKLKGKSVTPAQAEDLVKGIATKVGKKLGHIKTDAQGNISTQPMTSLKNYIDFASQVKFFEFFGLPLPKYLEQFMKTDNKLESKVIAADVAVPAVAPVVNTQTPSPVVKTGDTKEKDKIGLTDDEGRHIDQTGGPITRRLALQFLDGEAQNTGNYR